MSYKSDQIRILEMLCSQINGCGFDGEDEKEIFEAEFDEEEFKAEGFSYYGAIELLNDIFGIVEIKKFRTLLGLRALRISFDSNAKNKLFNLKYPYYKIESFFEGQEEVPWAEIPDKISITIDKKKGIYKIDNPSKIYKIKIPSKKFSLIDILLKKEKISLSNLSKELSQTSTVVMKAVKEINVNLKENLSISDDLIIRLDTSGYSLNKDSFDINS